MHHATRIPPAGRRSGPRARPAPGDYRLLTLLQASNELGVRWVVVRELVETGQLRAVRIGARWRVPASALAELGRAERVPSPAAAGGASRRCEKLVREAPPAPAPERAPAAMLDAGYDQFP